MITIKQQEKLIERFETLSELELDSVLEDLVAHLEKNHLWHLIEKHTGIDDLNDDLNNKVENLEDQVKDLDSQVDDLQDKLQEITNLCESADDTEEYDEGAFDSLKKVVSEIKSISE